MSRCCNALFRCLFQSQLGVNERATRCHHYGHFVFCNDWFAMRLYWLILGALNGAAALIFSGLSAQRQPALDDAVLMQARQNSTVGAAHVFCSVAAERITWIQWACNALFAAWSLIFTVHGLVTANYGRACDWPSMIFTVAMYKSFALFLVAVGFGYYWLVPLAREHVDVQVQCGKWLVNSVWLAVDAQIVLHLMPFFICVGVCACMARQEERDSAAGGNDLPPGVSRPVRGRALRVSSHCFDYAPPSLSEREHGAEDDAECAICLQRFETGARLRRLRCGHVYHVDCIDEQIQKRRGDCPYCQRPVRVRCAFWRCCACAASPHGQRRATDNPSAPSTALQPLPPEARVPAAQQV